MTRMLVSVTGPDEAAIARDGGADLIELAEADPVALRATAARLAGWRDLGASAASLAAAAPLLAAGAAWVRVPATEPSVPQGARVIGVLFADRAPDFGVLPALAAAGFAGVMLDTAEKGRGRLLSLCDLPTLARFVALCRAARLSCGFAGGLEPPDVPRLLRLAPDLLGFRGALCAGGRLSGARVRLIRALIPHSDPPPPVAPAAAGPDRVFVHGLTLPASIGAYVHERGARQRLRFDVTVELAPRSAAPPRDMRDVYSYDLISDGIRMLVAAGHVDLVETLAERVAALLLEDARVQAAEIKVTKLGTGAGRVGVAIRRERGA